MRKFIPAALACVWALAFAAPVLPDNLSNYVNSETAESETPPAFAKGVGVTVPDGTVYVIEEILPNGYFRAGDYVFAPDGVIAEGPGKGLLVVPAPANSGVNLEPPVKVETPKTAVALPAETGAAAWRKPLTGAASPVTEPKWRTTKPAEQVAITPEKTSPAEKPAEKGVTVADLLPKTRTPAAAAEPKKEAAVKPKAGKETPREKPDKAAKPEKAGKTAPTPKAKPGQPIHIPAEAIKSGDLSFLEGCWEGTRPEYATKRTLKECFCFNAGGKSGKRWINDFTQGRKCIGAARAVFSSPGELSVKSDRGACSDGSRWSSASMVCRGDGKNTKCSWIFHDVGNGSQSYQIPFVRVESCKR